MRSSHIRPRGSDPREPAPSSPAAGLPRVPASAGGGPSAALGALTALALILAPGAAGAQVDLSSLSALDARVIGPSAMSGRVAAIEGVPGDAKTFYVGAATGGLWKSTDAGMTWTPLMDDVEVSSIGAVRVHPANPDLVWVGTGEGNMRNSSGLGRGVWRSLDGGESWTHVGLEESEHIHRIAVHPADPDVAYVAAAGSLWEDGGPRGVYRTTDGGESWERILAGPNERTGANYVVVDPRNPLKIFATLWEFRRWPHFFESGGPGSGLWVSHDGGDTWTERTHADGLPAGELGRIGVDVSPADPDVVYLTVEAERSAFLRSEDGGRTFEIVNREPGVVSRPFYYGDLKADPADPDRVYNVHGTLEVSTDGGRTFEGAATWDDGVHVDHHALWINPDDPDLVLAGNDGGVYVSRDRTGSWRLVETLPLAQYYEIAVDMEVPYNVYGGLQDNGSWKGPSEVWADGGIRAHHWTEIGFGDGFGALADPENPRHGYAMSQGGNLVRWDLETGVRKSIRPDPPADSVELRFNWNSPLEVSPHDPATIYYGSQFVHRSPDRGRSWETISPDLTTDNPEWQRQDVSGGLSRDVTGAENYTTVYALAASPAREGVLWAGTDDGNVHVTRDAGSTWTAVHDGMPDKPRNGWVSHVEPSPHDAGEAHVVVHDYMRGDWTPYLYHTTDFGESWRRVPTEGVRGPLRTLARDPVVEDLWYLGSEFGLWITLDGGERWQKWTHGVPTVPVRALAVHPREHDLVLGTHGRAAIILDDVRPLRALARDPALAEGTHLFEAGPTHLHEMAAPKVFRFDGSAKFEGENAPYGALLTYAVPEAEDGGAEGEAAAGSDAEAAGGGMAAGGEGGGGHGASGPTTVLEVLDADSIIRTDTLEADAGVNRATWDLRRTGFRQPGPHSGEAPEDGPERMAGPEVLPGTYTLRLIAAGDTSITDVEVRPDPDADVPMAERRAKLEALMAVGARMETVAEAVDRIRRTRRSVGQVLDVMERDPDANADALRPAADSLEARLYEVESALVGSHPDSIQGIGPNESAMADLGRAYGSLSSSRDAPTEAQRTYMRIGVAAAVEAVERANALFVDEVAAFRRRAEAAGIDFFPEMEPLEVPEL